MHCYNLPLKRVEAKFETVNNKTQYFRLRLYDSDFNALTALLLLSYYSLSAF